MATRWSRIGGRSAGTAMTHRPTSRAATALVLVFAGFLAFACSHAKPIVSATTEGFASAHAQKRVNDNLTISATVLSKDQAKKRLRIQPAQRSVLPILFAVKNEGTRSYPISLTHFSLNLNGRLRIGPALPGRAATLLRDTSESDAAALSGYLVFGVLAAPFIHSAEQREDETVLATRDLVFREAEVQPGQIQPGYLIFESPVDLADIHSLELEVQTTTEGDDQVILLPLLNPYTKARKR